MLLLTTYVALAKLQNVGELSVLGCEMKGGQLCGPCEGIVTKTKATTVGVFINCEV